jgi:outer membrane protein assembly factor BamB
LTCAKLDSGEIVWQTNVRHAFGPTEESVWGTCTSPLLVDNTVVINPGSPTASLVALDLATGLPVWQSPGEPHAYGSFIVATLGGVRQIVGYDRTTLGGWHPATGLRLWTYTPPGANDFNVPTPVVVGERLVLTTENNSTRVFEFRSDGTINSEPAGYFRNLAPDMSTPVAVGDRLFCVYDGLFALKLADDGSLEQIYVGRDPALGAYAPLIASGDRLLIVGRGGELVLVDTAADDFCVVSRVHLFGEGPERDAEIYAHPAIVGTKLYVRGEHELMCVELGDTIPGNSTPGNTAE